jgi:hypothetical protein
MAFLRVSVCVAPCQRAALWLSIRKTFMPDQTELTSEQEPISDEERRRINRETLPGLLFGVFTLVISAIGIVWLLAASMSG